MLPLVAALALAPPTLTATTVDNVATFRFSARGGGVRFECKLDAGRARRCASPYPVRLAPGTHVFFVRAVDRRGRRSAFARARVTVEARAPAVRVGREPVSLAYGAGSLWTADYGGGSVTRVDPAARRVVETVAVGGSPGGVAAGGEAVYVGNFDGTIGISQIDPATNMVVRRLSGAGQPVGLLLDGSTLWVADYSGFVERVDAASGAVVARIAVGGNPEALALGFGLLWVTNYDGSLSTIDPLTNAVAGGKINGDPDMDAVAVSTDAVWSTSFYGNSLLRIDPATRAVTKRIRLPAHGSGVLVEGGAVWTSVYDANIVLAIDPASGRTRRQVRVGGQPRDLVWDGAALWSVNQLAGSVSRFSPSDW